MCRFCSFLDICCVDQGIQFYQNLLWAEGQNVYVIIARCKENRNTLISLIVSGCERFFNFYIMFVILKSKYFLSNYVNVLYVINYLQLKGQGQLNCIWTENNIP
jgi:hypothetical protein